MREIRPSGSEGGEAGQPAFPTPIVQQRAQPWSRWRPLVSSGRPNGPIVLFRALLKENGWPVGPKGGVEKPTGADKTKLPKDQQRTPPPKSPAIPVEIVKQ